MKDVIGELIGNGEPAGSFNPNTRVWSEMAVRLLVVAAIHEGLPDKRAQPAKSARKTKVKRQVRG